MRFSYEKAQISFSPFSRSLANVARTGELDLKLRLILQQEHRAQNAGEWRLYLRPFPADSLRILRESHPCPFSSS